MSPLTIDPMLSKDTSSPDAPAEDEDWTMPDEPVAVNNGVNNESPF